MPRRWQSGRAHATEWRRVRRAKRAIRMPRRCCASLAASRRRSKTTRLGLRRHRLFLWTHNGATTVDEAFEVLAGGASSSGGGEADRAADWEELFSTRWHGRPY